MLNCILHNGIPILSCLRSKKRCAVCLIFVCYTFCLHMNNQSSKAGIWENSIASPAEYMYAQIFFFGILQRRNNFFRARAGNIFLCRAAKLDRCKRRELYILL